MDRDLPIDPEAYLVLLQTHRCGHTARLPGAHWEKSHCQERCSCLTLQPLAGLSGPGSSPRVELLGYWYWRGPG